MCSLSQRELKYMQGIVLTSPRFIMNAPIKTNIWCQSDTRCWWIEYLSQNKTPASFPQQLLTKQATHTRMCFQFSFLHLQISTGSFSSLRWPFFMVHTHPALKVSPGSPWWPIPVNTSMLKVKWVTHLREYIDTYHARQYKVLHPTPLWGLASGGEEGNSADCNSSCKQHW